VLPSRSTHTMRMLCKVILATVTFLLSFYSATIATSLMYAPDSALLEFWGGEGGSPLNNWETANRHQHGLGAWSMEVEGASHPVTNTYRYEKESHTCPQSYFVIFLG